MKTLAFTPAIALLASPALAHTGAHLHPHGGEALLVWCVLAAVGVVVLRIVKR